MKPLFYILMTAALAAWIWKRKSLPSPVGAFSALVGMAIGVQTWMDLVDQPREWVWLFHLYQLLAIPWLVWYFLKTLHAPRAKAFLKVLAVLFYGGTALYYHYHPEVWHQTFIPEQAFLGLFVILGTLFIFHQLYLDDQVLSLTRSPHFWLGLGNLIFYTGYIFSLGSYRYIDQILEEHELARSFLSITHYLNIFLYSMYATAFLCRRNTNLSSL